jgi:hypothetical protein
MSVFESVVSFEFPIDKIPGSLNSNEHCLHMTLVEVMSRRSLTETKKKIAVGPHF